MSATTPVMELVYATFDEMNAERSPDQQFAKTPKTALLGSGTIMDSLALINFLASLEDGLSDQLGHDINLLEDPEIIDDAGPLQTAGTLAAYIESKYVSAT